MQKNMLAKKTEKISLRDLQFKTQDLIDGDNEVTDDFTVSLKGDAETGFKLVASNGKIEVEIMPL